VGELLNKVAGISITHVPFQGGGPSIQSLLGGHISMSYGTLPSVLPYVQSRELKLIALTESKRVSELPTLPTINETVPGVQTTKSWVGLFAPAGTPIATRRRIHAVIAESVRKPEIIKAMSALGMKPAVEEPEAMDKAIASDLIFWKATIATAGLTAQ
jgi:tripartite-type tricarboxylate transporter receptor subunit TctC